MRVENTEGTGKKAGKYLGIAVIGGGTLLGLTVATLIGVRAALLEMQYTSVLTLTCNPDLQLEVDYLGSHYEGDTLAAKIFRGDMGVEVFLDDETEIINGFGMVHFDLDDDKYNADDVLRAEIIRYDSKGFASRHESGELVLEELCLGKEATAMPISYV